MDILELFSIGQFPTSIHRVKLSFRLRVGQLSKMLNIGNQFLIPPHTDRIEVFQSQPDEVKAGMAGSTLGLLLVKFDKIPDTG